MPQKCPWQSSRGSCRFTSIVATPRGVLRWLATSASLLRRAITSPSSMTTTRSAPTHSAARWSGLRRTRERQWCRRGTPSSAPMGRARASAALDAAGPQCCDGTTRWVRFSRLFADRPSARSPCSTRPSPQVRTGDLWLRLAERGPLTVLPQPLYLYHQHEGQRVSRYDWSAAGRRAFLAKHRASMSPSCVAFHECMIELSTDNWIRALRVLLVARRASAAALAMMTYVTSRVGVSRRDPGLPARLLASVLRRAGAGDG